MPALDLHMYQLLDKELPAVLMVFLMKLAFIVVLTVIFLKRYRFSDNRRKMVPLVFIETVELYFPDINKEVSNSKEEIEVLGKKMSRQCFSVMSVLLIPIIVGTIFITFWNVYMVEESVGGGCENNFDCFPKVGDDFLQQEPVNNCSMFEHNGNVTYECYRLVFRYAEGLGAAGGILAFTAVFSKLYFALLVTVYNNLEGKGCCRLLLYGIIWGGATAIFFLFIGISVGVEEMRETIFQTITDQIQFAMYALSLLVIILSGVVVALGIEIKNDKKRFKEKHAKV